MENNLKWVLLDSLEFLQIYKKNDYDKIPNLLDWQIFEMKIWNLVNNLKPIKISKEQGHVDSVEFDVYAEFEEIVLLIQCKDGKNNNIKNDIKTIKSGTNIDNKLYENVSRDKNVIKILTYNNQAIKNEEFDFAKKNGGVILWSGSHIEFYSDLSKKLGEVAQEIIFSDLTKGKNIKGKFKNIKVPIIKGKYANYECYNFLITPNLLKKICYVNRLGLQYSEEIEEENDFDCPKINYQRIIDANKIKGIRNFIQDSKNNINFFPSSVLINFDVDIDAHTTKNDLHNNIEQGHITIPSKYGIASVIDGQHRIFGYSKLEEGENHLLNVIAFKNLNNKDQAKIFVDINKNQKSVPSEVMWDLYTDLYDEENEYHKISKLIKNLNNKGPLKEKIYIPSISGGRKKSSFGIFINNLATEGILKNKNVYKDICNTDIYKYNKILNKYFAFIQEETDKDFLIYSNNGIVILLSLLNYFPDYIRGKDYNICNMPLSSLLDGHLKNFSEVIIKALNNIGIEELKQNIKQSSQSAKIASAKRILIECGNINEDFKDISNGIFLDNLKEDIKTEFKETLYFSKNEKVYSDSYFIEAILGTICSFINIGIDGALYIGISDSGEKIGIKKEYDEKFGGSFDKMKRFILDKFESNTLLDNFSVANLVIEMFQKDPFILKISFTGNYQDGVCIIKNNKQLISYCRADGKKIEITKENKASCLQSKLIRYDSLFSNFYQK